MVVILFSQGTLRVCKTAAAGIRLACLIDSPSTQGCQGNKGESHTCHSELKLPCPQGHYLFTEKQIPVNFTSRKNVKNPPLTLRDFNSFY